MPALRIICWNIQDLGTDQVDDGSFLDMMVEVIHHHGADLVCILETKSDEGTRLGNLLRGKLDTKSGKTWASHSSTKSGPQSNKPENYVFLWETAVVTAMTGFKFPDTPPALGFINKHIKSRYPYLGKVTVNGKSITMVAFHTCFETVDIVESNQNLSTIAEVVADDNVILMGDFNDKAAGKGSRPKRRGRQSFDDLYAMGATAQDHYVCALDELTSLQTKKKAGTWASTLAARKSYYDHFFWRSKNGQFAPVAATTIDVLTDLLHGNYLHDLGKAVFNNWAKRKNDFAATQVAIKQRKTQKKPPWVDIPAYGPTVNVTSIKDVHQIYVDAISDHLPVRFVVNVT